MKVHLGGRAFLVAAVVAAAAVLAVSLFAVLGVRSGVAGPDAAPPALPPSPGHSWSQIGDLPGTMWHSNNDGAGSTLDADLLDGLSSSAFAGATHNHDASNINAGTLSTDRYGSYSDLTAEGYLGDAAGDLARNNGALQSTLNADLLDGQDGTFYQNATNINAGTVGTDRYGAYSDLTAEGYLGDAASDLARNNGALQSTLNADLLDGLSSSAFAGATHNHSAGDINAGTLSTDRYGAYSDLTAEQYLGDAAGDLARNNGALQATLNADLLDGLHANEIVSRLGFSTTAVDSGGNVGDYTSVTVGADGLALISYYDGTNFDLKVTHCGNAACSAGNTTTTVDSGGAVGVYTSVTVGADGQALISYYDGTNDDLKVAHCGNAACSASNTISTVDSGGDVGWDTSVTVGADGLGLISYYDTANNGDLKVAHCSNAACSASTTTTVDDGGVDGAVGRYTSVTVGADGLPLISYRDSTNQDLKVAHCNDLTCGARNITTVDSGGDVGQYTSVTVGADGLGLIAYFDNTNDDLKVAHCSDATCSASTITTVNSANDVGWYTSATVGADGLGLISYFDNTNDDLKVAHCGNAACTASTTYTVDSGGDVGSGDSVTVGADGLGLISYRDTTNSDLKVAHCSNRFCVPYHRPR